MDNKRTLIIYHKEDADGLCSMSIIYNYLMGNTKEQFVDYIGDYKVDNIKLYNYSSLMSQRVDNIHLIGTTYAELSNMIKQYGSPEALIDRWAKQYDQIFMTDISFNEVNVMKMLKEKFKFSFCWFDHHAPIINASIKEGFDNIAGNRDTKCSATMLAWNFLYGSPFTLLTNNYSDGNVIPEFIRAISGYDSFNWAKHGLEFSKCYYYTRGYEVMTNLLPDVCISFMSNFIISTIIDDEYKAQNKISWYLTSCGTYVEFLQSMSGQLHDFVEFGTTIEQYEDYMWQRNIETWSDFGWSIDGKYGEKKEAIALFCQQPTCSRFFKSLLITHPEIKNAIVFKKNPGNETWTVSVYNIDIKDDEVFNVGKYLKKRYNGGGHAGAGGATLTKLQFSRIMKTKNL